MKARRGFTLVELLIGMVLLGIVSTAIYKLLTNNQRLYRLQTQRADLNGAMRAAALIIPSELRELDATDGDVIAMSATSITYKAMRGAGVMCLAANSLTITLQTGNMYGLRAPAVGDSLLVFAEYDPTLRSDNVWLHGYVSSTSTGTACAAAPTTASTAIVSTSNAGTNGVTTTSYTNGTQKGAPARWFEVCKLYLYSDGTNYWLGLQTYNAQTAAWGTAQPLVGPLTSTGLAMTFADSTNTATADVTKVAKITMVIRGQTSETVRTSTGRMETLVDSVTTAIALRNNARY